MTGAYSSASERGATPCRSFVCRSTAMNTKWRSLWPATSRGKGRPILRCFSAEPTGLERHFFWFAGDAPSIATKTAKSWRITKAMVVCWLDRCQTCSISIPLMLKAGDSEWGIPQSFLTELDVCQAQNTEKYELKHQAPFHYHSRFSLRRFQSLLHQA